MIETQKENSLQNILLENREKLEMSGVEDVVSFNDLQIVARTTLGLFTVKGSKLHIEKFNTTTKELNIKGKVDELKYSNDNLKRDNKNFLTKLFK